MSAPVASKVSSASKARARLSWLSLALAALSPAVRSEATGMLFILSGRPRGLHRDGPGRPGPAQQAGGGVHLGPLPGAQVIEAGAHLFGHPAKGVDLGGHVRCYIISGTYGQGRLTVGSQASDVRFDRREVGRVGPVEGTAGALEADRAVPAARFDIRRLGAVAERDRYRGSLVGDRVGQWGRAAVGVDRKGPDRVDGLGFAFQADGVVAHRRAHRHVVNIRVIHHSAGGLSEDCWAAERGGPVERFVPSLTRHVRGREVVSITLGDPLLDSYLAFVAVRARANTWLAVASDLKIFFEAVGKRPFDVTSADVFAFLSAQRAPRRGEHVVRLEDGEAGLAARTIARRLSSVRGLYSYLTVREDTGVSRNPVPTNLATRRPGAKRGKGGVPLVRTPRTLPRVLAPVEIDALVGALRTHRDRAMVEAMLLGGLRRCEVLGLRLEDVNSGERRLFVAEGKGGRQRVVPVSARFFASLGDYLGDERPPESTTTQLFVVLKGHRRGEPLSAAGLDEILAGARGRAGLTKATCHQLRHTCFTRLREAGMKLEAIQAQAGHASIESTRIYLHLANDWLEKEYLRAAEAIEAQVAPPDAKAAR